MTPSNQLFLHQRRQGERARHTTVTTSWKINEELGREGIREWGAQKKGDLLCRFVTTAIKGNNFWSALSCNTTQHPASSKWGHPRWFSCRFHFTHNTFEREELEVISCGQHRTHGYSTRKKEPSFGGNCIQGGFKSQNILTFFFLGQKTIFGAERSNATPWDHNSLSHKSTRTLFFSTTNKPTNLDKMSFC